MSSSQIASNVQRTIWALSAGIQPFSIALEGAGGQRDQHQHPRSALRGLDLERPVEQLGALAHHGEPEVAGLGRSERIGVDEAAAVVGDPQLERRPDRAQGEGHGLGVGVAPPALTTASCAMPNEQAGGLRWQARSGRS